MKKAFAILTVSFALVVFTTSANAQSATSISTAKPATASDAKTSPTTKEVKASANTATKVEVTAEEKRQVQLDKINEYEKKIEANRNNPRFDVKAAEAELARMKKELEVK